MLLKKNVVQVAVCEEDTCDQNDKPSNPPAPMTPYLLPLLPYLTQPAFTCSKLTKATLEQGAKYV